MQAELHHYLYSDVRPEVDGGYACNWNERLKYRGDRRIHLLHPDRTVRVYVDANEFSDVVRYTRVGLLIRLVNVGDPTRDTPGDCVAWAEWNTLSWRLFHYACTQRRQHTALPERPPLVLVVNDATAPVTTRLATCAEIVALTRVEAGRYGPNDDTIVDTVCTIAERTFASLAEAALQPCDVSHSATEKNDEAVITSLAGPDALFSTVTATRALDWLWGERATWRLKAVDPAARDDQQILESLGMDSDDIAYLLYQVGGSSTRPLFGQPPLPLTLRDGRAVAFWLCPPSVRPPKRRKSDIFQDLFGK